MTIFMAILLNSLNQCCVSMLFYAKTRIFFSTVPYNIALTEQSDVAITVAVE